MSEFHDRPPPCALARDPIGGWIPVAVSHETPRDSRVTVHVFRSAAEAEAFADGYRLANGPGIVRAGSDDLAACLAIETEGSGVAVTDHGGLDGLRRAQTWRPILALLGSEPPDARDPITIDVPTDGAPPRIRAAGHVFTAVMDDDAIVVTVAHALPTHLIKRRVWYSYHTQCEDIVIDADHVAWRADPKRIARQSATFREIAAALDGAERDRDIHEIVARIRTDPAHLRIPRLMQAGWRLLKYRHDTGATLFAPEGSGKPSRAISGAMLGRLLEAGLVRRPVSIQRLYTLDPDGLRASGETYHLLVGDCPPLAETKLKDPTTEDKEDPTARP
jgi:hypothetical protein